MSFPFWAALTEAEVSVQSAAAKQKIGTIGYTQDGRRFRYCKAGAALGGHGRLMGNDNYCGGATSHEDEDGFEGAPYTGGALEGATTVKIADTTGRAVNYYQGGYLNVFHSDEYRCYYILSSKRSSQATDPGYGAYVELELESGLTAAITTATQVTAYLSPYSCIKGYGDYNQSYVSFVCLPLIAITDGNYFWGQVGGPAWVTAHGGDYWPGRTANYRDVFAWIDGTIDSAQVADPTNGFQRVGTLLSQTVSAYGDAFVMLQLDGG